MKKATIIKSGFLLGISTLVKITSGLVVMKLLAWKFGPEQFGIVGQIMTVIAIISMFAGGGISNGLIRYIATYADTDKRASYIEAGFSILVTASILVGCLLILFSTALSNFLLHDSQYAYFFWCLAVAQVFVGANNLSLALLSGTGDIRSNVICNIGGVLLGTILFCCAFVTGDLRGSVIGLLLLGAAPAIFSISAVARKHLVPFASLRLFREGRKMRELLSYSVVMLVAVSSVSLAQILIRDRMGLFLGWESVGYWQGLIKLSDVFMQFAGVILINYAIPRYAATSLTDLSKDLLRNIVVLLTVFACIYATVYLLRNVIIVLIFSQEFLPLGQLIPGQLFGDLFRIAAATITYVFLAKGFRTIPVLSELFQGVGLWLMTIIFLPVYREFAPVYAHLCVYSVLFLLVAIGFRLWLSKQRVEAQA